MTTTDRPTVAVTARDDSLTRRCATLLADLANVVTPADPRSITAADAIAAPDGTTHARSISPPGDTAHLGSITTADVIVLLDGTGDDADELRASTGAPVVLGQDLTAIALAAQVLTTLARAGRAPRSAQVVIAGARALPVLSPLVMLAGAGQVTTWNPADAPAFPLPRVAHGADVVVDLRTGPAVQPLDPLLGPPVIVPAAEHALALVLPGLVRALLAVPSARLDVEVHHACALELVMATPPAEPLPRAPSRELTERIAVAAAAALRP